jgi:uncharacterized protein (DUF2147 family)
MRIVKFLAVLALMAGPAAADPVEGIWQTQPDAGSYAHVRIGPCGDKFCGVITRTFKDGGEYKSDNIGKMLVINAEPQGGGKYGGKVWQPSTDRVYLGKLQLSGNSMQLAGCVAGGLICKKQTWRRVQ